MRAVVMAVAPSGPRFALPLRGTSAVLLTLRPRQCLHRQAHHGRPSSGSLSTGPQVYLTATSSGAGRRYSSIASTNVLGDRELALLQSLVNEHGIPRGLPRYSEDEVARTETGQSVRLVPNAGPFKRVFEAARQHDSRKLLVAMGRVAAMSEQDLHEAVYDLPRSSVSELLRLLDPVNVAEENDPTDGMVISRGMWQHLDLRHIVDEYGERRLYHWLEMRIKSLLDALRQSGQLPTPTDLSSGIRAAGAAAANMTATDLWHSMLESRASQWRDESLVNDFMQARFLTHPKFYGYDKVRVAANPQNLYNGLASRRKLDWLKLHIRKKQGLFGLTKNRPFGNEIGWVLRRRGSVNRVSGHYYQTGVVLTERLICSLMVALARTGSLRKIQGRYLWKRFGIKVWKDNHTGEIFVGRAGSPETSRSRRSRPPTMIRPLVRPTERLLFTVAHVYGSNGRLDIGLPLIQYISEHWKIPIPGRLWTELLESLAIFAGPRTRWAWNLARLPNKLPDTRMIGHLWQVMTSAPYYAQPSFEDYNIYIQWLLEFCKWDVAIGNMGKAREMYDAQCHAYEELVFEYVRAIRDGVEPSGTFRAVRRARYRMQYMWYRLRILTRTFLVSKFRSNKLGDEYTDRKIPDFVYRFREFLPHIICYRTATGYVQLNDPVKETVRNRSTHKTWQRVPTSLVPNFRESGYQLVDVPTTEKILLHSHSLLEFKGGITDPWRFFGEDLAAFRGVRGRRQLRPLVGMMESRYSRGRKRPLAREAGRAEKSGGGPGDLTHI